MINADIVSASKNNGKAQEADYNFWTEESRLFCCMYLFSPCGNATA